MKEPKMKRRFAISSILEYLSRASFYTDKAFINVSGIRKYGTIKKQGEDNLYCLFFDNRFDRAEVIAYLKKLEAESTVGETVVKGQKIIVYGKEGNGKIKIVVREILENLEKWVEIVKIENVLPTERLPSGYMKRDKDWMFMYNVSSKSDLYGNLFLYSPKLDSYGIKYVDSHCEFGSKEICIKSGNKFRIKEWEKLYDIICACGRRLAAINTNLKKEAVGWGKTRIYHI